MEQRHRFIFTLPVEVFKKAKSHAFERNISLSLYVLQAILWRLGEEKE